MNHSKKIKGPVTLRYKVLSSGCKSLYLDIYWNGKRSYEFLKMYLNPETKRDEIKELNHQVLKAANAIVAKRTQQLIMQKAELTRENTFNKITLDQWFEICEQDAVKLAQSKNRQQCQNARSYKQTHKLVQRFIEAHHLASSILLSQIDKNFLEEFCHWLRFAKSMKDGKPLAPNTQSFYFKVLSSVINKAYKKGEIAKNPILAVEEKDKPHKSNKKREYLTIEELQLLYKQPGNPKITKAFLFSCLTGLRLSDITTLKWSHLHHENGNWIIEKEMIKTQELIYLPLCQEAMQFLPQKRDENERLFPLRTDNGYVSKYISKWVNKAGINKHITFHCARHTFATILLTLGEDIYTTSQLLGHKDIHTTQIYADIVNSKKAKAMSKLNGILK